MRGLSSLRAALIAIGVVGFLVGLGAVAIVLSSDYDNDSVGVITGIVVGWSFVFVGLYAWYRRPTSRFGAFMTAAGFSWFIGALGSADNPWIFGIGFAFGGAAIGFLVQMIVSFPDGRLHGRSEKGVVALVWFIVIAASVALLPFTDTSIEECDGCPDNPYQLVHDESLYDILNGFQLLLAVIALIWLIVVMRSKVRAAPRAQKPIVKGVYATTASAIALILLAAIVVAMVGSSSFTDLISQCARLALALVPFAFLFGLLRSRLSSADAVGELMLRLGDQPRGGSQLRDSLASALSDPTLKLAYALPGGGYVDSDGVEMELPDSPDCSCSSVQRDGREVAQLIHASALDDDPELVESVGAAATLALENERLEAELRANVVELRASRARLVEAGDAERRRVERDLHDGAQQHLVALALTLRMARDAVETKPAQAGELLDEAAQQLETATAELRELARGIHPAVLSDRGLAPALEALAGRSGVPVEMTSDLSKRLPAPIEAAAYFVVAEALTNTARYAKANKAKVQVERENGSVCVSVTDDGIGGADATKGSGLRGLSDRLAALDGTLDVKSSKGGTTITAVIPCA